MKNPCLLLLAALTAPAQAGDQWEIVSASADPDGKTIPYTQRICMPSGGMDPAQMLGGLGNCTFDQKSGDETAMTFAMTCKTPDMPADLGSMKVSGDAKLNGDRFDMRYSITVGGDQSLPGGDFKMPGSLEARKIGTCSER
jgi:hypothetical protein